MAAPPPEPDPQPAPPRFAGRIPEALLAIGVLATLVNVGVLVWAHEWGDPAWMAEELVVLGLAAWVRTRRPDLPSSLWFALMAGLGPAQSLCETLTFAFSRVDAPVALACNQLVGGLVGAVATAGAVLLIGLFPDGRVETRTGRALFGLAWAIPLLALAAHLLTREVLIPFYVDVPALDNPLAVLPFTLSPEVAGQLVNLPQALGFVSAFVVLLARYRRSGVVTRRRIRWLLLPIVLIVIGAGATAVLGESAGVLVYLIWLSVIVALGVAVTGGILYPAGLDIDVMLRRTIAFGGLWLVITAGYVGVSTLVGTTVGRFLPVPWAVAVALLAALFIQPVRTRLEALADRRVFGRRTDQGKVIARLGHTLSETFDLDSLLPRMSEALEQGLAVEWVQVGLTDEVHPDAAVVVPVDLDGERLGVVQVGPKKSGTWTDADQAVVETFARQAALAIRNVRLNSYLATHAAEIAASRTRLVKAQEAERRRIERNIHDGVQQDLVALIGLAGQIPAGEPCEAAPDPADLELLRSGLARVLEDLRDLARGIHPSLLTDKGLLAAVEGLVARHPVPVDLRADPALRELRFADEGEAACYFTISEALANSLKYGEAERVAVTMELCDDRLRLTVEDDGVGFCADPRHQRGMGLASMQDRFAALDGTVEVRSSPGAGTTILASIALDAEERS